MQQYIKLSNEECKPPKVCISMDIKKLWDGVLTPYSLTVHKDLSARLWDTLYCNKYVMTN